MKEEAKVNNPKINRRKRKENILPPAAGFSFFLFSGITSSLRIKFPIEFITHANGSFFPQPELSLFGEHKR